MAAGVGVAGREVNYLDPEKGVLEQHRTTVVGVPRRDGSGVDLLLKKTVKTIPLLPILQPYSARPSPRLYHDDKLTEATPLTEQARDDGNDSSKLSSCCSCTSLLCTVGCLISCLPCDDRACFTLWQVITWFGLLSLIPLTAFGSFNCEPLHSANITTIIMLVSIAILSAICFLYHCCCTKENRQLERCCLSCCGCLFIAVFITTMIIASYLIFQVPGTYDTIMHGKYLNTTINSNTTTDPTYIYCHFSGVPFITLILSYLSVLIYLILCTGCFYYCVRTMADQN